MLFFPKFSAGQQNRVGGVKRPRGVKHPPTLSSYTVGNQEFRQSSKVKGRLMQKQNTRQAVHIKMLASLYKTSVPEWGSVQ